MRSMPDNRVDIRKKTTRFDRFHFHHILQFDRFLTHHILLTPINLINPYTKKVEQYKDHTAKKQQHKRLYRFSNQDSYCFPLRLLYRAVFKSITEH